MKNPLIEFITKTGTIVRINITAITSISQKARIIEQWVQHWWAELDKLA